MAVEGVERSFVRLSRYRRLDTIFGRSREHLTLSADYRTREEEFMFGATT
jgi:hypothetical protein